jgi:hypothetical protein
MQPWLLCDHCPFQEVELFRTGFHHPNPLPALYPMPALRFAVRWQDGSRVSSSTSSPLKWTDGDLSGIHELAPTRPATTGTGEAAGPEQRWQASVIQHTAHHPPHAYPGARHASDAEPPIFPSSNPTRRPCLAEVRHEMAHHPVFPATRPARGGGGLGLASPLRHLNGSRRTASAHRAASPA